MIIPRFKLPQPGDGPSEPGDSHFPQAAAAKIGLFLEQQRRTRVDELRQAALLFRPLMTERQKIIDLPDVQVDFWLRAISHCSQFNEYITIKDAEILREALQTFTIQHFEMDEQGKGEPRSLRFIFEFKKNRFFHNTRLVKDLYWRKRLVNQEKSICIRDGLVSEPVRINWKSGVDPTRGLLDAACNLADAEKRCDDFRKIPELPEYDILFEKLMSSGGSDAPRKLTEEDDSSDDDDDSERDHYSESDGMTDEKSASQLGYTFFSFFGYRGQEAPAEYTAEAKEEDEERHAQLLRGEIDLQSLLDNISDPEVPYSDPRTKSDSDDGSASTDKELPAKFNVEIFDNGEKLANALEEFYHNAMDYYLQSFDLADSDVDMDRESDGSDMIDDMCNESDNMYDEWESTDGSSESDEDDCADENYIKFLDQSDWSEPTESPEAAFARPKFYIDGEWPVY
ncbi:hypothetical protein N7488_007846 [Penicillium malachiteum]|nr:hypothetical protein N7488_007846 [Penicillium malachiteum]